MSWTRIAVYWAAAVAIGGWLWLSGGHTQSFVPKDNSRQPLIEVVTSRVDHLYINGGRFDIVLARDSDQRWRIIEPGGLDVARDIADAVIDTLAGIPIIETVSDNGGEDSKFGLDPPQLRLRMVSGEQVVANLAFGKLNPTRTAVYVRRVGKSKVFLLGLNARYYIDLILEDVARQLGVSGADGSRSDKPSASGS